ncbi:MAG: hypothetical protein WB676_09645 [Bryobacteraceae bacterium]
MKPMHLMLISAVAAATATAVFGVQLPAMVIPSGSDILVRANETIDSRTADEGRVYSGTIDQDILDSAGNVAVHKGARAELLVREVEPKKELVLDLQSVIVNGRRHFVNAGDYDAMQKRKGIGKNWRTAKMVGGGTAFGSILGALAGGGSGAAIGALSGAAGGGALQLFTRGKAVKVPAEAVLTFQLEKPLNLYAVE